GWAEQGAQGAKVGPPPRAPPPAVNPPPGGGAGWRHGGYFGNAPDPGVLGTRGGADHRRKLGTPLPPRQRHVEADAQERPDEGGGAEKCRGTEHEPEIADAQAHEGGDPSPRRPDPERRVRADVARGLDREVEPHVARRRVRPELADGERAGPRGERGAEDEPLRAADDRPLIDEFTEAGGERHRRERSGAQRASVADIEALD